MPPLIAAAALGWNRGLKPRPFPKFFRFHTDKYEWGAGLAGPLKMFVWNFECLCCRVVTWSVVLKATHNDELHITVVALYVLVNVTTFWSRAVGHVTVWRQNAAADARGVVTAAADDELGLRLADYGRRTTDVVVPAVFVLPGHSRLYVPLVVYHSLFTLLSSTLITRRLVTSRRHVSHFSTEISQYNLVSLSATVRQLLCVVVS